MQNKQFKHHEIEKCNLCKKEINTTKDNYTITLDATGENIYAIGFYHTLCLRDVIKGKGKVIEERWKEQLKPMFNWANGVIAKATGKDQVVNLS